MHFDWVHQKRFTWKKISPVFGLCLPVHFVLAMVNYFFFSLILLVFAMSASLEISARKYLRCTSDSLYDYYMNFIFFLLLAASSWFNARNILYISSFNGWRILSTCIIVADTGISWTYSQINRQTISFLSIH